MGDMFNGTRKSDPHYDCVLSLFSGVPDSRGGAVLVAPYIALAPAHCFSNHTSQMSVRSSITKTVSKVIGFHSKWGDYVFGVTKTNPIPPTITEFEDEIVILDLADALPGPFAAPVILDAQVSDELEIACEDAPSQNAAMSVVMKVGALPKGQKVLLMEPLVPGGAFAQESGASAFLMDRTTQWSVAALLSGSGDGISDVGGTPDPSQVHSTLTTFNQSLVDRINTMIGTAPKPKGAVSEGASPYASADVPPPAPGKLAPMQASDPGRFVLTYSQRPHCYYCFVQIPTAKFFSSTVWLKRFGWGFDMIFSDDDQIQFTYVDDDHVKMTTKTIDGIPKLVDITLEIYESNGRRLWLYQRTSFTTAKGSEDFDIYLFRTHDEEDSQNVSQKCFRIEAYKVNGGILGEVPSQCTVTDGCTFPPDTQLDMILTAGVPLGGLRQDDIGTGHEHD